MSYLKELSSILDFPAQAIEIRRPDDALFSPNRSSSASMVGVLAIEVDGNYNGSLISFFIHRSFWTEHEDTHLYK